MQIQQGAVVIEVHSTYRGRFKQGLRLATVRDVTPEGVVTLFDGRTFVPEWVEGRSHQWRCTESRPGHWIRIRLPFAYETYQTYLQVADLVDETL